MINKWPSHLDQPMYGKCVVGNLGQAKHYLEINANVIASLSILVMYYCSFAVFKYEFKASKTK